MSTLPKYFTEANILDIRVAKNFNDLFLVAKNILSRMPDDLYQVCGPISTGGLGSRQANIKVFEKTVEVFLETGLPVFNQIPFEEAIWRISDNLETVTRITTEYIPCLEEFYLPLFKTGKIKNLLFIPGWESSRGSNWERDKSKILSMSVIDLPPNWVEHFNPHLVKELFPVIQAS